MAELSIQDVYLLEKAVDPNSDEFRHLMSLLLRPTGDDRTPAQRLNAKPDWKFTLPYRGDPEDELIVRDLLPFQLVERGVFRNGLTSLAFSAADMIDLVSLSSSRRRMTPSICVSDEGHNLRKIMASSGNVSSLVYYATLDDLLPQCLNVRPETIMFDHTTVMAPIDEVLNLAYRMGVHVVDGVFPYHVAAVRGWDIVAGAGRWSYTHSGNFLTVGPDNDCSRLIKYTKDQYMRFLEPSRWTGNSKKYGFEIRKCHNGLATYRAVYLAGEEITYPKEHLSYSLPMCSDDDMIMINVNRDLASGVFTSSSNNAQELARVDKNYAIEVRRELFNSCVMYLIAKNREADIVGESIRYISQHNYVDLVEGVRVIRCPSLSYADALCVSMVCSLTAFSLRYRLTNESIPDVYRHQAAAQMHVNAPFGAIGRLAWLFGNYLKDAVNKVGMRAIESAKHMLYSSDYIPGVCYDVYSSTAYMPDLQWFEPHNLVVESAPEIQYQATDAFTSFIGEAQKTAAPTVFQEKHQSPFVTELSDNPYVPNVIPDPKVALQHVYDEAFPGNSTAQLQNVAELKKVKDVNINTEFYGKIEPNKDIVAHERLHEDAPIRTAALPVSNTPLLDAILASAKRNFNPPDIQLQNDPWEYARYLAHKFMDWAFVPNFRDTIGKSYKKDPLSFNVQDYIEWLSTRDGNYRSALEAECPEDMVELGLEKYDTIIKKRIKPKLSVTAQYELSQPQVIVSLSKKDTALFTSLFRKIFERFDNALRPEIKSAGRLSDDQISIWLTQNAHLIKSLRAIELDSSKYDKSQGLLARMIEAIVMQDLGLDPGVSQIFSDSHVGKVSSRSLGLMFVSAYQMKSGAPQTMLGNLIYNMVSAMESVGSDKIRLMIAKGDDNVLWVSQDVDPDTATSRMSALFNLEAKLIYNNVLYFSSGYIVPLEDRVWFVPDPVKMVELLGEMGANKDVVAERFVSFRDRVRSLTRETALVPVLQRLVRARLGVPDLDVVMCVDALAAVAGDFKQFQDIVSG
nr:TPA_asm: P2 protein [Pecan associated jivivirus 1]